MNRALVRASYACAALSAGLLALGRHGWASLRHWAGQIALAINAFFAIAFVAYALASDLLR